MTFKRKDNGFEITKKPKQVIVPKKIKNIPQTQNNVENIAPVAKEIATAPDLTGQQWKGIVANLASKLAFVQDSTSQFIVHQPYPSGGICYPEKSRIIATTYPYRDVKRLSDSKLPLDMQYEIMLEGVTTHGFKKEDLTLFDFIYVNLLRKMASMKAPKFSVAFFCPKCQEASTAIFELAMLGFDGLEKEDIPGLPIVVNFFTIGRHSFSPITVGGFINIVRNNMFYLKDKHGAYIENEKGIRLKDKVSFMAQQCISMPFAEAYRTFSMLDSEDDIALLEKVDDLLGHGLLPLDVTCKTRLGPAPTISEEQFKLNEERSKKGLPTQHPYLKDGRPFCGNKVSVGLVGGESIIIPFRGDEGPTKSRISFGA